MRAPTRKRSMKKPVAETIEPTGRRSDDEIVAEIIKRMKCPPQVIPNPIDQNPWAHWRSPMDMMRQG